MKTKIFKKLWFIPTVVTVGIFIAYGISFLHLGYIPSINKIDFFGKIIRLPFGISRLWEIPMILVFFYGALDFIYHIKSKFKKAEENDNDKFDETPNLFATLFIGSILTGLLLNICVNFTSNYVNINFAPWIVMVNGIIAILALIVSFRIFDGVSDSDNLMIYIVLALLGGLFVAPIGFNIGFLFGGGVMIVFAIYILIVSLINIIHILNGRLKREFNKAFEIFN